MRRSATVTSSVPLASIAAAIVSSERKPPVPSSSREVSSRSPIVKVSSCVTATSQPPWIARRTSTRAPSLSSCARPLAARDDLGVDGHGDAAVGQLERREHGLDRRAAVELGRLAVDEHVHAATSAKRAGSQGAAHSGRPSPASTETTASAVTSASRMPLR